MLLSVTEVKFRIVTGMQNYKTIEEKAVEWGLSSRHIQHLCRRGKIDGAIKRAGSWFVPSDVPSPAQNSKTGVKNFDFIGTKKKIFNSAIELFVSAGFDNVSLRDIANKVGIRQSTIYNHFKSKQEILDAIYNFYTYYYLKDRLSLHDMEAKLQSKSVLDIIGYIRYDFGEEYQQKMSDITKIVFQRIGIDARAKEISKSLMVEEGVKYVEDVFNIGIKNGRFAPFDTHIAAVFINSVRIFTLYNWIVDSSPEHMMKLLEDEQVLYKYVAGFLVDIQPETEEP